MSYPSKEMHNKCNIFYQALLLMNSYTAFFSGEDKRVGNSSSTNVVIFCGPGSILGYSSYMDDVPLHPLLPLTLLKGWCPSSSLSLSSSASLVHYNFYPGDTYWSVRQLSLGRQSKIRLLRVHNKYN